MKELRIILEQAGIKPTEVQFHKLQNLLNDSKSFHIPELGDRIALTENWEVPLIWEKRNETLYKVFGYERK